MTITHHHVSLAVLDLNAQEAWYSSALGFTHAVERVQLAEPPVRTVVLQTPAGLRVELIERAGAKPHRFPDPLAAAAIQGYGHWALQVEDLDTTFDRLTASGAAPVSAPADAATPGDRYAYIHDPEGNLLELIQVGAART
jgi:catechol 2,3-dioxygenase-like lactoylglutathione lyase family enzyme